MGDERKLKQILYNLLSNAVKFTPQDGQVGIEVDKVGNELQVEVWDTGSGFLRKNGKLFSNLLSGRQLFNPQAPRFWSGVSFSQEYD